ncbi:white collar 2 type of transcription factor [Melanogaster broomeanus]|nr:white collar 2 type of transcription factor [Melanogaster broomeanus]
MQSSSKPTPTSHNPTTHQSTNPTTFEFTKRKRWADLLIHELSEAIIFVLSNDASIWFCGRAVSELLGWKDAELIDRAFTDLVNSEDLPAFNVAFDESLRTRREMNSYVRLKTRSAYSAQGVPQSEVLFEMKGYPHFIENELSARCFFAVAKPYPGRNVAMLNSFLELKIENERLQRRLAELRVRASSPSAPASGPSTAAVYPHTSSSLTRSSVPSVAMRSADMSSSYYPPHQPHQPRPSYDDLSPLANQMRGYDPGHPPSMHPYRGQYTSAPVAPPTDDDLGDDGTSRRRKIRKTHSTEQHVCVTCGRTDSPEWRKGPQGPKTLCNACGLRWAKEIRSKVDDNSAVGTSTGANAA